MLVQFFYLDFLPLFFTIRQQAKITLHSVWADVIPQRIPSLRGNAHE